MNVKQDKSNFFVRVYRFYLEGFRSMTLGKTLWKIIILKLVIFFGVIKICFFPNFLGQKSDSPEGKAQYVREQLISPSVQHNEAVTDTTVQAASTAMKQ